MSTSDSIEPRKKPQQARARATVEALLEATAQLLVEDGYANTTTNHIAQRAGVSVGSLYQYFPNKDALVAELSLRFLEDQVESLAEAVAEAADRPMEQAVLIFVRSLLRVRRLKPDLTRVLFTEIPRLGETDHLQRWFQNTLQVTQGALASRQDEPGFREADLKTVATICVGAVDGIVINTILYAPELLDEEQFAEEIALLLLNYLKPGYHPAEL